MDKLWPQQHPTAVESELEEFYAYPAELDRPWVRVNFVSSLDGAVTLHGTSRGLSSPEDQKVLALIRDLSDVVLVGAGTALAEGYHGVKRTEVRANRRQRLGLAEVPPIAVVTAKASIPADSPLLTDTVVPPIVLTCAAAAPERVDALREAGADVVVAGEKQVDLRAGLAALHERGLRRIGCEGGPKLFGSLIEEDLVDELCLTLSPLLTNGDASRIASGSGAELQLRMQLRAALHADSMLLLRYERQR